MINLLKEYKRMCKKEFSSYGFINYKNNHYRLINDIYQSFSLHRSLSGNQCTVEFAVIPLCSENLIDKTTCRAQHLKMFEDDFSWFSYDKCSEKSIKSCIQIIEDYLKKYLIPYFERADDCTNAYNAIYEFELKHFKKGVIMASMDKFSMALKMECYDIAIEHLNAMKMQTMVAYKTNISAFGNTLDDNYKKRIESKLSHIDGLINNIVNKDMTFINSYINMNETTNRNSLTKG